jgi:hypothetical protein
VEELHQAQPLTQQILHEAGPVTGGPGEGLLLDPQPAVGAPATPPPLTREKEAWPQPGTRSARPKVSPHVLMPQNYKDDI